MTPTDGKMIATIILAFVCLMLMKHTHGEHGIGWFVFGLMVIW